MLYLLFIIVFLLALLVLFIRSERFGQLPDKVEQSHFRTLANYDGKSFKNINHTPDLTEGVSLWIVLYEFLFKKGKRTRPRDVIPTVRNNLKQIKPSENVLVWFGHSSYFMQIDGRKFLVDPVLSGNASPLNFTTKSFAGTDTYTPDDFPEIDYLFISHDHWDHLDHKTVKALKPKIKHIICGLGVKAHLVRWGFNKNSITEKDWHESFELENGFKVNTTSGRHFSGRGFKRNQSLWMSYVLTTPGKRIFIGGDSGYDTHFDEIGKKFGPFDWTILECGQYDNHWKYIHMHPSEVAQAAAELNTKMLLPVHWGKFSLSKHDWDEPITLVSQEARKLGIPFKTPMIGEILHLDNPEQETVEWWKGLN